MKLDLASALAMIGLLIHIILLATTMRLPQTRTGSLPKGERKDKVNGSLMIPVTFKQRTECPEGG